MTTILIYGPRKIGARRLLSLPRPLLLAASIAVPGRVVFEKVGISVFLRNAGSAEIGAQMLSKVGQLVTPSWVMQTLGVRVGGVIYARASIDGSVELIPSSGVRVEQGEGA
jgi:hypothetical protein